MMSAMWLFESQVLAADAERLPAEVSIPNTKQVAFVSKVNGRHYVLRIALPYEPAPAKGYGVLYVIDGNWYIGSASEAVRNWNAPNVVVVAIGYPDDPAFEKNVLAHRKRVPDAKQAAEEATMPLHRLAEETQRDYDLTLPVSDQELADQNATFDVHLTSSEVGGLDAYLKMIETDVKPRVEAMVPINKKNQALFGDSFGGLAVVHALFVEPNAFRTFIAGSPSIWWNKNEVLKDEAKFAAAVNSGQARPRVLVTMGSEESTLPNPLPAVWHTDPVSAAAILKKSRMVENARELVARLKALHGAPGYEVADYAVFDHEDHGAASWSALARGVPFAFAYPPKE